MKKYTASEILDDINIVQLFPHNCTQVGFWLELDNRPSAARAIRKRETETHLSTIMEIIETGFRYFSVSVV